jgi:hypothetical protein
MEPGTAEAQTWSSAVIRMIRFVCVFILKRTIIDRHTYAANEGRVQMITDAY